MIENLKSETFTKLTIAICNRRGIYVGLLGKLNRLYNRCKNTPGYVKYNYKYYYYNLFCENNLNGKL